MLLIRRCSERKGGTFLTCALASCCARRLHKSYYGGALAGRDVVFSPLLLLLAVQGGFTSESKFAFVPLDGDAAMAVKKSASNDDLQALAEVLCLCLSPANPCMVSIAAAHSASMHTLSYSHSLARTPCAGSNTGTILQVRRVGSRLSR